MYKIQGKNFDKVAVFLTRDEHAAVKRLADDNGVEVRGRRSVGAFIRGLILRELESKPKAKVKAKAKPAAKRKAA